MRRRGVALAMCALLMVTSMPPPTAARADDVATATVDEAPAEQQSIIGDGAELERWNQEKFWTYLACGVAIVAVVSVAGAVGAAIACGRAATLYWTT